MGCNPSFVEVDLFGRRDAVVGPFHDVQEIMDLIVPVFIETRDAQLVKDIEGSTDDAYEIEDLHGRRGERTGSGQPRCDFAASDDFDALKLAGGAAWSSQVLEAGREDYSEGLFWVPLRIRDSAGAPCLALYVAIDPGPPSDHHHSAEERPIGCDHLNGCQGRDSQPEQLEGEDQAECRFIIIAGSRSSADVHFGWEFRPLEVIEPAFEGGRFLGNNAVQAFQERLYLSVTEVHRLARSAGAPANTRLLPWPRGVLTRLVVDKVLV